MKKVVSREAIEKEATFWKGIRKAVGETPRKVCHK